jgi:hypothetical protein
MCNTDKGFGFVLKGRYTELLAQQKLLEEKGFEVGMFSIYPALLSQEDYDAAIKLIWETKCKGWQKYRTNLLENGVCVADEFNAALGELPH